MKKNMIAVCDSDGEYACNFAEYLNNNKKLPFSAEAFTDAEKLCRYAGASPPEILLIAEADVDTNVRKLNPENIILLSEDKEKQEKEHKCIYKYQSADSVIREIMEYYVQNSAAAVMAAAARKIAFLGVYSPVGRCEKTLFSMTAAQILGESKQVLYINMEDYSGFEALFGREYEKNLSDLFYEMRCKEADLYQQMDHITEHAEKFDYLVPAASPEDIRAVQFAEWVKLFDVIRTRSQYEIVILDLGSSVDQVFRILDLCSSIYIPVQEDWLSRCKMAQFRKLIESRGTDWTENITEITLPGMFLNEEEPGFPEMLVWGRWGNYVRKVLGKYGAGGQTRNGQ